MKKLRRSEVQKALITDQRFRNLFPDLKDQIDELIKNPSCPCAHPLINKILMRKDILQKYFPNKDIEDPVEELKAMSENNWKVLSCKIDELEGLMKRLHRFGRKQIAIARYEEEVTVLINELNYL